MLKKITAAGLFLLLTMSSILPCAAAASQEERLSTVTLAVKKQLTISDEYTDFYGEPRTNGAQIVWSLHWSNDADHLSVEALENGTILSYYCNRPDSDTTRKTITGSSREQATRLAAQSFLKQVLRAQESAVLVENLCEPSDAYYAGTIYYHQLPTDNSFTIRIAGDTPYIESFYRSGYMTGQIPAADPKITIAAAREGLQKSQSMKLSYVADAADTSKYVLRYLPTDTDTWYVDAQSGKLVNLSQIQRDFYENLGGNDKMEGTNKSAGAATMDSDAGGLTDAEQAGAALLKDALSKEQIDKQLRAISALGLSQYELKDYQYTVLNPQKNPTVLMSLSYHNTAAEETRYKEIQVNAKTGQLRRVQTWGGSAEISFLQGDAAQTKAAAFLQTAVPDLFAQTALEQEQQTAQAVQDSRWTVYTRLMHDYPVQGDSLRVAIEETTGHIYSFYNNWTEDAIFAEPAKTVEPSQALTSYLERAQQTTLQYISLPAQTSDGKITAQWILAYTLQPTDGKYCTGIDAITGNPCYNQPQNSVQYTDTADYPQINALANSGIGYQTAQFEPTKPLTQEAALALLYSMKSGSLYRFDDDEARERLYRNAYRDGILTSAQYAPNEVLTRAQMIQYVIRGIGYGQAAELTGIFQSSFADETQIPQQYYGAIAIAQGLGLIRGDEQNIFHPNDKATRMQLAFVLYQYLNR